MKYIFVNLKRFDIPTEYSGINSVAPIVKWGGYLVNQIQDDLERYHDRLECAVFFPEAHLIPALNSRKSGRMLKIGCQSVFRRDTADGGNFGALTGSRSAKAMKALGCEYALVGHCEERADKAEIIKEAGADDSAAVNRLLNQEVLRAIESGLRVLYCIGEKAEEQGRWSEVLTNQLEIGLRGADLTRVAIAYEPVWSIGPGMPVPDRDYIQKAARLVKSTVSGVPFIYGGGLKKENAKMIASIPETDGGLVGLTRFSGDIGFYPDGFLEIVEEYFSGITAENKQAEVNI